MTTKGHRTGISLQAGRSVRVVVFASVSAGAALVLPASSAFAAYSPTYAVNQTTTPTFTDGETFVAPPGAVY